MVPETVAIIATAPEALASSSTTMTDSRVLSPGPPYSWGTLRAK